MKLGYYINNVIFSDNNMEKWYNVTVDLFLSHRGRTLLEKYLPLHLHYDNYFIDKVL